MELNENYFHVTFKQSHEYLKLAGETKEGVVEKVEEKVVENQKKILEEIRKDKYTTAKKLSATIGISERKIQDNMRKLREKGLIKRVGPDKGGHWKINPDEN